MKKIIAFGLVFMHLHLYACPLTITNDTNQTVFIIDPSGLQAILLNTSDTAIIDPTVKHRLMKYISNEKLDIYYPKEDQSNDFYKKYTLTEKYCSDNPKENELTISQIVQFSKHPSDRFTVHEFQPIEKMHDDTHH